MTEFVVLAIKIVLIVTAFDLFVLTVLALSMRFRRYQRSRIYNDGAIVRERDSYQRVLRSLSSSLTAAPGKADNEGKLPTH